MAPFIAIRPNDPDFWQCNEFYGSRLKLSDCYAAVDLIPNQLAHREVGQSSSFSLPWNQLFESCQVTVEVAGPNQGSSLKDLDPGISVELGEYLRSTANWAVAQCVGLNTGIGGFVTRGLGYTIDYSNRLQEQRLHAEEAWPTNTSFVTVSFTNPGKLYQPGNFDPSVALRLYEYSTRNVPSISGDLAKASKNPWYYAFLGMYQNLQHGENVARYAWWDILRQDMDDQMAYTCDANMGTPKEYDCYQVISSGLGPPSDIVVIPPGIPVIRTINSCTMSVQSITPFHATWAQITTAIGVLLQLCVMSGSMKAGGWANFHANQPKPNPDDIKALVGTNDSATPPNVTKGPRLSGLNALPPSISVTLYETGKFRPS